MKKIISLLGALALVLSFSFAAYAAENDVDLIINNVEACTTYQDVLDMLNKEYGTDVHFPSAEEREKFGIPVVEIDVSLEEFEAQMRKDIEANLQANVEAKAAAQKLNEVQIYESGSGICAKP